MKQIGRILCRSQSEAILVSKTLSACGVPARLTRPPRSRAVRSCAWAVEIEAEKAKRAETCLHRAQLSPELWSWEDPNDLSR